MGEAYIGIDGKARKIKNMYIGVDGVARKVKNTYIGLDGIAKIGYQGLKLTNVAGLLYDNGAVGKETGGWESAIGSFQTNTYINMKPIFRENQIELKVEKKGYYCSIRTKNTFDLTGQNRIKVTFNRPVIGWGIYLSSAFVLQNGQIGLSTVDLDDYYNHDETLSFGVFEYNCPGYVQIELFSTTTKSTDSIMYISKIELETFA